MTPLDILLIEDNEGDIVLTKEALAEGTLTHNITVQRNGADALQYLSAHARHSPRDLPDLILLDINLPRIDGKEVLKKIKTDHQLKTIPVIVLTTSSSEKDINESYENHANCYIIKPIDLNKFMYVVKIIESFWLSVVIRPTKSLL